MKHQSSSLPDRFRLEILRQMIDECCWTKYVSRKKMKAALTAAEYEEYLDNLREPSWRVPAPPHIRNALKRYTRLVAVADELQERANKGRRMQCLSKPQPGVPNQRSPQDKAYAAYLKAYEFLEELHEQFPDIEIWLDRKVSGEDSGETCQHIPRTVWSRSGLAQTKPRQSRSTITFNALIASRDSLLNRLQIEEGRQLDKRRSLLSLSPDFGDLPQLSLNWPD